MILVTSPMMGGSAAVMASVTSLVFLASLTRLSVKAFSLSTASRASSGVSPLISFQLTGDQPVERALQVSPPPPPVLDGIVSREEGGDCELSDRGWRLGLGRRGSSASLRGAGSQGAQMRHHGLELEPPAVRA